jgi:hypothetical protein
MTGSAGANSSNPRPCPPPGWKNRPVPSTGPDGDNAAGTAGILPAPGMDCRLEAGGLNSRQPIEAFYDPEMGFGCADRDGRNQGARSHRTDLVSSNQGSRGQQTPQTTGTFPRPEDPGKARRGKVPGTGENSGAPRENSGGSRDFSGGSGKTPPARRKTPRVPGKLPRLRGKIHQLRENSGARRKTPPPPRKTPAIPGKLRRARGIFRRGPGKLPRAVENSAEPPKFSRRRRNSPASQRTFPTPPRKSS